jgi:hypothetical protein
MSPMPARLPLAAVAAALCAVLVLATPARGEGGAAEHRDVGAGPHSAGVVVDTGDEVKAVCVRFTEEEITGQELLDRTRLEVEWARFGDLGAAACGICGVGCPADDCHCAMPLWWSYWQADGGDGWTTSPVGAGTRTVRDGDMDAWVWGDGRREPPQAAFEEVCSDRPPAPTAEDGGPDGAVPAAADGLTAAEIRGLVWLALTLLAVLGAVVWRRRQRAP